LLPLDVELDLLNIDAIATGQLAGRVASVADTDTGPLPLPQASLRRTGAGKIEKEGRSKAKEIWGS